MTEKRSDRRLEDPANLGAPGPSSLSPRASRYFDQHKRALGRESGRVMAFSVAGGFAAILLLAVVGLIVRG